MPASNPTVSRVQPLRTDKLTWYILPLYHLTAQQLQYITPLLAALFYNNRAHFLQHISYDPAIFNSVDACAQHVTKLLRRVQSPYNYILFDTDISNVRTVAQCIGVVGIKDAIDTSTRTVECGYLLDQRYVGNGVVTTTLQYAIQQCMQNSNVQTVELHTSKHNTRSVSVARRLHFVLDSAASSRASEAQKQDINVYKLDRQDAT